MELQQQEHARRAELTRMEEHQTVVELRRLEQLRRLGEQEEQRSTVLLDGRLLRLQCICQLPPASIVTPFESTWIHFGIYPKENALHVCIVLNIYNNWKL